jgi:hypothetical protein
MLFDTTINPFLSRLALLYRTANLGMKTKKKLRNRCFTHYFYTLIHFIAFIFFRKEWKKAYLILIATMLIDLDHLLVEPIFETNRCSINFHLYIRITLC